jgi:hypothetical protein
MRSFASEFLLPLVRGGPLKIGRPLGLATVPDLCRGLPSADRDGVASLAARRLAVAARLIPMGDPPPLDETTVRLGAALHNLLVLGHPGLAGAGRARAEARIVAAALELAQVGPPRSAREVVNRHSLLARLPDIVRVDRTVHFWLGRQVYVGRTPPRRVTALPGLRRVRVDRSDRSWLREIGVPAPARAAFVALNVASPLGEALDPFRLEPPLAWGRVLPVLRFPSVARVVAGRVLAAGVDRAGDAFADALYRFAGYHDPPGGVRASAEAVRFAVRFLAHVVWLDVLFGRDAGGKPAAATGPAARATASAPTAEAGVELAVLLSAAARVSPALVWPDDVAAAPEGDPAASFRARLDALAARAERHGWPRYQAALAIANVATSDAANGNPTNAGREGMMEDHVG